MTHSNRCLTALSLRTVLMLACAAAMVSACGGDDPAVKKTVKNPTTPSVSGSGGGTIAVVTPGDGTAGTGGGDVTAPESGAGASGEVEPSGAGAGSTETPPASSGGGTGTPASGGCTSDKECVAEGKLCNKSRKACVECLATPDCEAKDANSECIVGACVKYKKCTNSLDCTDPNAQVCDDTLKRCVDCVGDSDCTGEGKICKASKCQTKCDSDVTCKPLSLLCDKTAGYCVACTKSADCGDGKVCESNQCVAGGGSSSLGAALCKGIPAFKGTQKVDGKGDEFDAIPGEELSVVSAAYNKAGLSGEGVSSKAVIRAGWSETALHVHVHVDDANIFVGGQKHDGDNVQVFVANAAPATGGSQLLFVPPAGEAAAASEVRPAEGGPQLEAAGMSVDGGYDVEFKWTWPGEGFKQKAGNSVALTFLVGAQDAADKGVQAEYGLSPVPESTTECKEYWCNPALWCAAKLLAAE